MQIDLLPERKKNAGKMTHPTGKGIAAIAASMTLKKKIYHYNKYWGSDPEWGISDMAPYAALKKKKPEEKSLEIIDTE